MLDFVFLAMFGIIAIMGVSIYLVRFKKKYQLHKMIQIVLGIVLLVAVTAFEVDMRFITKDWRSLAEASPYFESGVVSTTLWIHLCFAVPTPVVWLLVIINGCRKFPSPPQPNEYSAKHIIWARIGALLMTLTAVTGWIFYVLAFVM